MASLSRLLGCNLYVSEGRNADLIRRLEALARSTRPGRVALAHSFVDGPYNRTGLTLTAADTGALTAALVAVCGAALASIDLRQHVADHPRLGAVDHISLHPLGPGASLAQAAEAARSIGQALAGPPWHLPVYLYGAAHPAGRRLAHIRRQLGYFTPREGQQQAQPGSWAGALAQADLRGCPPDLGPSQVLPAAGVVTLGAVPWVVNYNVPLATSDMAAACALARAVSARGGGLPGVEAMALPHGPGVVEIATNLVDLDWRRLADQHQQQQHAGAGAAAGGQQQQQHAGAGAAAGGQQHGPHSSRASDIDGSVGFTGQGAGPAEVQAAVAAQAAARGLPAPGAGYITNKLPQQLIQATQEQWAQAGLL